MISSPNLFGTPSGSSGQIDKTAIRNRCLSYIADSKQKLSANLLIASYESLDKACGSAIDSDLRGQIVEACKPLEEAARKVIADADKEFAAGNYTEAMRRYRQMCYMSKLKAGVEARNKIKAAEKDAVFAAVVRNAKAAEMYSSIHFILRCKLDPDEGDGATTKPGNALLNGGAGEGSDDVDVAAHARRAMLLSASEQVRLMGVLDTVIKVFHDTPSGAAADALRTKLMGDAKFAAGVEKQKKEDNLRGTFEWAQQHERAGQPAKAIESFRKVMADGPGTDWAYKAKAKIDSIERERKANE